MIFGKLFFSKMAAGCMLVICWGTVEWDLAVGLYSVWFTCGAILMQVKGVEQELDAEDEDTTLAGQME